MPDVTVQMFDVKTQTAYPVVLHDNGDGTYTPAAYVTAELTLSPTNLATGAKQDTGNTSLALLIPAPFGAAITPNDGADLANNTRGLYVGVSGDVKVDFVSGGTGITLKGLAAGVVHPFQVKRVYATGTTATDIVGVR